MDFTGSLDPWIGWSSQSSIDPKIAVHIKLHRQTRTCTAVHCFAKIFQCKPIQIKKTEMQLTCIYLTGEFSTCPEIAVVHGPRVYGIWNVGITISFLPGSNVDS